MHTISGGSISNSWASLGDSTGLAGAMQLQSVVPITAWERLWAVVHAAMEDEGMILFVGWRGGTFSEVVSALIG